MSGEIQTVQPTGQTLYSQLVSPVGTIFTGSTFEAPLAANWAAYAIALAEQSTTGIYTANFPVVAAGAYSLIAHQQLGGSPATSDPVVAAGSIPWTGTAVETPGVGGTVTLGATAPAGWINTAAFATDALVPADVQKVKGGDPVPLATPIPATLVATGLDQISIAPEAGVPTTFRGLFVWMARRFYRSSKTPTSLVVEDDAGAPLTTQAVTDDGQGTESLGPPS